MFLSRVDIDFGTGYAASRGCNPLSFYLADRRSRDFVILRILIILDQLSVCAGRFDHSLASLWVAGRRPDALEPVLRGRALRGSYVVSEFEMVYVADDLAVLLPIALMVNKTQ